MSAEAVQPTQPAAVRPRHPTARPGRSLRLPAFWLVLLLLLGGAWRIAVILHDSFGTYPRATAAALGLFALYAVPFWVFVQRLDYLEREPPLLLATAFAWGGLVATSTAIPGNAAVHNLLAKLVSPQFAASWGSAIAGPTIEEFLKTLGIVAIVLMARAQMNSVLDGVVYGALVGLGFQVVENIVYAVNAVALVGHGDQVSPVVATFFLRGFLAGLWSHTLFSALAGAGIAYVVVRKDREGRYRLLVACACLFGAWFWHALWNSPILVDGIGGSGYGVLAVLLIKGLPPLAMILFFIRAARHREANYYVAQLSALDDPEIATPSELTVLSTGHARAAARRYAHGRAGIRGRTCVRKLQRAQARLAVELSRIGQPAELSAPPLVRWYREVLIQRAHLEIMGHPEGSAPSHKRGEAKFWLGGLGLAVFVIAGV